MWWLIEYMEWDAFKDEGECIGGFNEKNETCTNWDKTLARFNELIKDDNVPQVYVTTYWGDKVYDEERPYVLTYDAG